LNAAATSLDANALIKVAEGATGLSDWGDTPFLDALEILCRSASQDDLSHPSDALGVFRENILRLMGLRLRMTADRNAHPEIPAQVIRKPLIVIGLPRSGTTILHSLLSQDPRNRSPQKWEVDQPSPPPRAESYASDPRIADAAAAIERVDPTFRAMHQMGATLPEECNNLQMASFRSLNFWARLKLPGYSRWLIEQADMAPAYEFHRQFLQHLQAFAPRDRWVLKGPPHLFWPETLLETYPDARVVMTHRDPAEVLPSNASLIAHLRGVTDAAEAKAVGAEQMIWLQGLDRTMAYRSRTPRPDRFVDVHYRDFIADPLAAVRAIYAHFDIDLTQDAGAAMRAFMANNQPEKHGKHVYTAEQFGLDAGTLHRECGKYIQHYGIEVRS